MSINPKKDNAFTLIELLVSITLLSIVYAYSFVELSNLYYKLNQRLHLKRVKNFIELAQAKSFHSESVILKLNNNQIYILVNGILENILKVPSKYKISFPNTNSSTISFYSSGVQTPFRIDLNSFFYLCNLKTSLRGRIKSECKKI